jgi:hypothetical protein
MRKLSTYILLLGLLIVGTGCDSNGSDDTKDADVFFGTWALGGISDGTGDRTAAFVEGFTAIGIGFERDGGFSLTVDAVVNEGDANYSGEYGIVEQNTTVSVSINVSGQAFPLVFTYEIVDDNQIKLSASGTTAVLLGSLFETSLTAPVIITLVKG